MNGITRAIFGVTFVAVVAISAHTRTDVRALPMVSAEAQPQSVQSAGVHRLIGSSFHAIRAGL